MRRFIFICMLAAVSAVWSIVSACGVSYAPANLPDSTVTLYGDFQSVPAPCYSEECPTCLTYAFYANGTLYYLSSADEQIQQQLDIDIVLPSVHATITGTTYTIESDNWLNVQSITFGEKPKENYHPMLAVGKQWNYMHVLISYYIDPPVEEYDYFSTTITDTTLINGQKYYVINNLRTSYVGKVYMREDTVAQMVWILPNETAEEQLLFNFNVVMGDTLRNITFYSYENPMLDLSRAEYVVTNIGSVNGRKSIRLHAIVPYNPEYDIEEGPYEENFTWIEGVGEPRWGLSATRFDDGSVGGMYVEITALLCVQQDDELLYASAKGQEFGCWYDSNEQPADTIPLYRYTGDGPDGSTVDPVDPNQVVVILQGDELTIREFMGEDITYNLEIRTQNNAPAQAQAPARNYGSQTFREYVAIQLTEDGRYTLQLTNPEWGYGMVATFNYGRNALQSTSAEQPAAQKILQNGQLLIRQGERMFTPTGMQVGVVAPTDDTD